LTTTKHFDILLPGDTLSRQIEKRQKRLDTVCCGKFDLSQLGIEFHTDWPSSVCDGGRSVKVRYFDAECGRVEADHELPCVDRKGMRIHETSFFDRVNLPFSFHQPSTAWTVRLRKLALEYITGEGINQRIRRGP
jgi:hypothetical protein